MTDCDCDAAPVPSRVAAYVPTLRACGEDLRLRAVLHEFAIVRQDTPADSRRALVRDEPERLDPRWDAFLAAYTERLCRQDGIEPPAWVFGAGRHLRRCWYPGGCHNYDRVRTVVTTLGAFEAHGI